MVAKTILVATIHYKPQGIIALTAGQHGIYWPVGFNPTIQQTTNIPEPITTTTDQVCVINDTVKLSHLHNTV